MYEDQVIAGLGDLGLDVDQDPVDEPVGVVVHAAVIQLAGDLAPDRQHGEISRHRPGELQSAGAHAGYLGDCRVLPSRLGVTTTL